ncbi:hypothetical protein Tco_0213119 [Tanacetum coccineum]
MSSHILLGLLEALEQIMILLELWMLRLGVTWIGKLGQRMTDFVTTVRQDTNEIYRRLDDAQDDRLGEARAIREAWAQSMDASDTVRSEVRALRTTILAQQIEIKDLRVADHRRQAQLIKALMLLRTLQTHMVALQS